MINFSIDYLTRKDENSSEEGSPRSSPVTVNESDNFNVSGASSLSPTTSGPASKNKPGHSYIALISMAILESTEKKVLLGDIYSYIMTKFPYYNNQDKSWKNSIRHNLSLNECFIKNGRAENGKGNYWSIHPACIEDFSKGDFRRRQARRRARKSAMADVTSSSINMAYRNSVEYIPMTSSSLSSATMQPSTSHYQPMSMPNVPVPTTAAPNMLSSAFMYPALMSSTSNMLPYDNGSSMIHPSFMPGAGYPTW